MFQEGACAFFPPPHSVGVCEYKRSDKVSLEIVAKKW